MESVALVVVREHPTHFIDHYLGRLLPLSNKQKHTAWPSVPPTPFGIPDTRVATHNYYVANLCGAVEDYAQGLPDLGQLGSLVAIKRVADLRRPKLEVPLL